MFAGSPTEQWETGGMAPPPNTKLPPIPQPPIKRWIGAGRPVGRWNKLRKDPELWDPNGDVLVFLCRKGQSPRPQPSFRLSSHIIEATESRYLVTLLREGFNEEDVMHHHHHQQQHHHHHLRDMPPSPAGHQDRGGGPSPMHLGHNLGRGGQPTPPVSEDASLLGEVDGQISYEMYFATSTTLSRTEQLRHQLTTRNVFALLYHSSLVGLSMYQALTDLHSRLNSYMPSDSDNVGQILNYLTARGIDDVRGDPETAVSLLAWAESPEVRWDEGWRECFIHCAGMYGELERCADFKHLTPITRALLERACLETQLRVQAAEERLAELSFNDMWSSLSLSSPAWASADRLRRMLLSHYTRLYGSWPPAAAAKGPGPASPTTGAGHGGEGAGEDMWLTRTVTMNLQRDFGALYDYLVNRDVVWDVSEARSGRKWMIVSAGANRSFAADAGGLPMTDMLIEFDNKQRFPHIPHPYPLIPESIPPTSPPVREGGGGGLFGSRKTDAKAAAAASASSSARAGAMERRVHLAYTESTNIYVLGSDFTQSDLIDAFVKFEKTDKVGEVDPATARLGRWVLIYGILQVLASVSVDAPGMRYRDGVPYHLSPRLKGTRIPPWKGAGAAGGEADEEACHELSHCWVVPRTWRAGGGPSSSAESSGGSRSASPQPLSVNTSSSKVRGVSGGGGGGGYRAASAAPPSSGGTRSVWSYGSSSAAGGGFLSDSETVASSVRTASQRGYAASGSSRGQRERGRTVRRMKSGAVVEEEDEGAGPAIRDFDAMI